MSETTNINSEDILYTIKRSERLGVYKTLNWLCWEMEGKNRKDATPEDILNLIHAAIGDIGEELCNNFVADHHIFEHLSGIIEDRKKQETETEAKKE